MILNGYPTFGNIKKGLVLLAICILSSTYLVRAQNTVAHSSITFKAKNLGIGMDGSIGGLQATIQFNPKNLAAASFDASVDVKTLTTDNSMRDDHLKSDEFFDMARYPKILLKSIAVTHKNGNKYMGQFNLTIKNKTRTIEIPFTYMAKGDLSVFTGSFKIDRLDYGLGSTSLTLSDEVDISIEAEIRD